MYKIMRIPLYINLTTKPTKKHAYTLFEVATKQQANDAIKVLTDFNTHPPGAMQSHAPHHFIKVGSVSYKVGQGIP